MLIALERVCLACTWYWNALETSVLNWVRFILQHIKWGSLALGWALKSWRDDLCWMLRPCWLPLLLECPSLVRSGKACLCLPWNPLLCLRCGVIHGVHFGWVLVFPVQARELGMVHRTDTSSVNNSAAFCNVQCTRFQTMATVHLRDCPRGCVKDSLPAAQAIPTAPKVWMRYWGLYVADYLVT